MNWLAPTSRKIRSSGVGFLEADTMVLSLITLSNICKRHVPLAPEPQVEALEGGELHLSWYWVDKERVCTISVAPESPVTLTMTDSGRAQIIERPSYEQLKTAVCSFFDGWVPRG